MNHQPELTADDVATPAQAWNRPLVTVPAIAVLALVGGFFQSFTLMANLYVLAVGGTLLWFGLSGRVAKRRSPVRLDRAAAWWLVPAGVFVAIELTNFMFGSTYPHPTLSVLVDGPLDKYSVRSLVYFIWLGGFWGLVQR